MRRAASALVLALTLAGCGSTHPSGQRALDAFFAKTKLGRSWDHRFPHRPGSRPCTAHDRQLRKRVPATCSTDLETQRDRVLATFTVAWSHGNRVHAWFVSLRRDGTVASVTQEGAPHQLAPSTTS